MKRVITIVALTVMGLAGCGSGLKPSFAPAGPPPAPAPDTSANVSAIKAADIAGTYTIDSVTFASDLPKDYPSSVPLTRTLKEVTVGVNGEPVNIQARLDQAYLIITPAGVFSFYYSIVNAKGELVKAGPFLAGSMSGTIKTDITSIGFVAGETNGLADEQEALYGVQHDTKSLTLTVDRDALTPSFTAVHAVKE